MGALQLFDVSGSSMRFGADSDGRPYVVADDFTPSLGYSRARNALRMVDADERGAQIVSTPGGPQQMDVLYEDGIWELIFLSRKPEAKDLKKRVKAILREIRETGSYGATPPIAELSRRDLARMVIEEADRADAAEARATELEGPAHSWEVLASGKGDYSVRDAAKILSRDPAISVGERRLFTELADAGWIYRQRADHRWRVYQAQIDNDRMAELPQQYEDPATREKALAAPQARIKVKGLRELHRLLGGVAPLQLGGA